MHKDKFVFAQLVAFLDRNKFNYIVRKYVGDKYVKHSTCWNQLLALMFGQQSNRESLRDLIIALDSHNSKCYHLGMGRSVSRSSLARANQDRDYHIFEEYAYYLVNEARQKRVTDIFKLDGNVFAFDSTTIDLCLTVFWLAKFCKKKGGIKVHTLYDVETQIPTFFHITETAVHDSKAMRKIPYESVSYYIIDRDYNNFNMLSKIHQIEAYFVIRAKKNLQFSRIYSNKVDKTTGLIYDQIGKLQTYKSLKSYPGKLRRVKYYDAETNKVFIFITNNVELTAFSVTVNKLFFKWIK